jgi:hypothetical protein
MRKTKNPPPPSKFHRSGPTFWQQYTSFWLTSLLSRIILCPSGGAGADSGRRLARPVYRWLHMRHIDQLHRALGNLERDVAQNADKSPLREYEKRLLEIAAAVRSLKVARAFEVDLQRLRIHLHMAQEDISRMQAASAESNGSPR